LGPECPLLLPSQPHVIDEQSNHKKLHGYRCRVLTGHTIEHPRSSGARDSNGKQKQSVFDFIHSHARLDPHAASLLRLNLVLIFLGVRELTPGTREFLPVVRDGELRDTVRPAAGE
jgi:hypothetical protein